MLSVFILNGLDSYFYLIFNKFLFTKLKAAQFQSKKCRLPTFYSFLKYFYIDWYKQITNKTCWQYGRCFWKMLTSSWTCPQSEACSSSTRRCPLKNWPTSWKSRATKGASHSSCVWRFFNRIFVECLQSESFDFYNLWAQNDF